MKRLFLTIAFTAFIAVSGSYGQVMSKNAIGVRLENHDGLGPQFSYQLATSDNNRLEFDLGFANYRHYNVIKFTTFYHWVFNITGGLNWFVGFGAGVGIIDPDDRYYRNKYPEYEPDGSFFLTADGDVGLEYSFLEQGVPLQLALDINPAYQFGNDYYDRYYYDNNLDVGVAFSVRYQF